MLSHPGGGYGIVPDWINGLMGGTTLIRHPLTYSGTDRLPRISGREPRSHGPRAEGKRLTPAALMERMLEKGDAQSVALYATLVGKKGIVPPTVLYLLMVAWIRTNTTVRALRDDEEDEPSDEHADGGDEDAVGRTTEISPEMPLPPPGLEEALPTDVNERTALGGIAEEEDVCPTIVSGHGDRTSTIVSRGDPPPGPLNTGTNGE